MQRLRNPGVKAADKLRLALLYVLRYEGSADVASIKSELSASGMPASKVALVDKLLLHCGQAKRAPGLYGDRGFMSRMARNFQSGLAGVANVYTQHVPLLINTLDMALKGKLKESSFGTVGPQGPGASSIVVFVVGGVTYEEATKVAEMNASGSASIVLGGTTIHNSTTFLTELAEL